MEPPIDDNGGSGCITAQLVRKENNGLVANFLNRTGPAQRNLGNDFPEGLLTPPGGGKLGQMKTREHRINADLIRR